MDTIGERIKRVRKINELNQIEFSKIIGVSQGTLSEIEQDKYFPSTETIMAIYILVFYHGEWCPSYYIIYTHNKYAS